MASPTNPPLPFSASIDLASDDKTQLSSDGIDYEEYELRKRLPRRLPKRKNDIYISTKTNFKAQLQRCKKLLESGSPEIYIHGLGFAIDRAVNVALQLKALGAGSLEVAANTTTVELVDDLEPLSSHVEPEMQTRNVSAVHIKVFRLKEFLTR